MNPHLLNFIMEDHGSIIHVLTISYFHDFIWTMHLISLEILVLILSDTMCLEMKDQTTNAHGLHYDN